MAASNTGRTWLAAYKRYWLFAIVVLAGAGTAVAVASTLHHQPAAQPKTSSGVAPSPQRVTAGGQAVPAAFQAKAKRLGYYCPSWNQPSGTMQPLVCYPLDK